MAFLASITAYFVVATLIGVAGVRLGRSLVWLAAAPFAVQLWLVARWAAGGDGALESVTIDWLPALGVDLTFRIDPLTVLLTAVVASIGLLIVVYSSRYMSEPAARSRFLAFLVLFSGGMAGLVTSDNLFGLFVFWEVTTVASYLLIGFQHESAQARSAALQAVLVTTAGGLAMLGGFVLLAIAAGTSSISTIVAEPPGGPTVRVALVLVLLGAFTKSAQVPFHFWLPGAMAAPTPASAYLHSATMVKAGIVLLLFLAPGFSTDPVWTVAVSSIGLVTMVVGGVAAMRQHDLKLLLAHGTVSQLGFMVALLGLGYPAIALTVLVAHAAFKATLFLVVGIIDKKTGTRDIRHLAGIRRTSPVLAAVAALAALSMAGVPPLLGFVTKEAAFDALIAGGQWTALTVVAVASALTVAYTARFWWGAFEELPNGVDVSGLGTVDGGLLAPPAALAVTSVAFGVFPWALGAAAEVAGETAKLVLWPGWKPALAVSAAVLATGSLLHWATHRPWPALRTQAARMRSWRLPSTASGYAEAVRGLNRIAEVVTGVVQNGSLPVYLAVILGTIVAVTGTTWLLTADASPQLTPANGAVEVALASLAIVTGLAAARAQRRMVAALLLGAVGFAVAGLFVTFGAPDLALTQLLVETVTVALFAFVLARLPRRFGSGPRSLSKGTRLAVAVITGVFVTTAALVATSVTADRTASEFYIANAEGAGGRNVVNVILTDFRALDTLGEVTVLAAAGIGVAAMVRAGRRRLAPGEGAGR